MQHGLEVDEVRRLIHKSFITIVINLGNESQNQLSLLVDMHWRCR